MGTAKVTTTNKSSGATSKKALILARRMARAKAFLSGVPSAVVNKALSPLLGLSKFVTIKSIQKRPECECSHLGHCFGLTCQQSRR